MINVFNLSKIHELLFEPIHLTFGIKGMSYYLPLFPLNLVAFPGERLNLHIFEPRYKDLINDCLHSGNHFGIPAYVISKIEYGTEIEITEVHKKYSDGRMDIKTLALSVFVVKKYANPWPDKSYAGGLVETVPDVPDKTSAKFELIELLDQLYGKLDINQEVEYQMDTPVFQLAHKVGLSKEQEYQLLQLRNESSRVKFLISHLKSLIPKLLEAGQIISRIKMNGHFRHLDSPDF